MTEVNYSDFLGIPALTSLRELDFMQGMPGSGHYVLNSVQKEYLQARGMAADRGIIVPKQVHGERIWPVTGKDMAQAGVFEADAVITQEAGLPIGIRTADCLPALLYDPVQRVIAAVHAGWKSTRLDIVYKTVEFMRNQYAVQPSDIRVAVGPCIRTESCEVGPEFKAYFPRDTVDTAMGIRLDIFGANLRQLTEAGVRRENILDSGFCSFKDAARFHSFRRDGESSGRMLSALMMV